jgi:hypothetical protein
MKDNQQSASQSLIQSISLYPRILVFRRTVILNPIWPLAERSMLSLQ